PPSCVRVTPPAPHAFAYTPVTTSARDARTSDVSLPAPSATVSERSPTWQSRLVALLVRARMRPHALRPIDPASLRPKMGRPKSARHLMLLASGSRAQHVEATPAHPPGDWVTHPNADPSRVMLYLHGGGFFACSPVTHRPLVGAMVARLGLRAFVPDYRLAPEHPYPAALDDAMQAYRYLIEDLRIVAGRVVIAGDSAGGGLALSLAMRIRDEGLPRPAALVMYSPWTDMAVTGHSIDENSDRCAMFAGITIRRAAPLYLGATPATDPGPSPVYGDFRALPPMLIHASTDEVLRDDAVRVAERARAAGVTVEFRMWPHVPHVWQFFPAVMPEAAESLQLTTQFVNRYAGR
ncbi:MAG: alpha/beta hydrolase, partial [Gemmatimonas sp.]